MILFAYVGPANAGTSGFRARTVSGDNLPGTCSFTAKNLNSKAASFVSAIQKKSTAKDVMSYWSPNLRSSMKNFLRLETPKYAVSYRAHTFFSVTGYKKTIGNVVLSMESGVAVKSTYKYIAMLAVLYEDGKVSWYALKANPVNGQYRLTISSTLCETLSKSGRTCLIVVIGESYIWW